MKNNKKSKSAKFFTLIKNLFILLLFLQFAPMIFVNIKNYIKEAIKPKTYVGCLNIRGLLEDSNFYVKKIQQFSKDSEIKALLLKVESPGGLPGTSQAIFNELKKFKKEKPVVVLVENICASGGYYVAAAGNHIISAPSALVGSIGVLMQLPNVKELLENWKIKFSYIQSGKFKTAGSPLRDTTPEELAYLQNLSEDNYKQFVKDIAESRNLDINKKTLWADGKVFTGTQALELKLVDQIGSLQDAIDKIKEIAKIETEIKFVYPKRPSGLSRLISGGADDETDSDDFSFSSCVATSLHAIFNKFFALQAQQQPIQQ